MKFRMAGIKKHSVVDGVGVRLVIFFQGCPHHCMECHNPDTWDPDGGDESDTDEIIEIIKNTRYIDGITLSGGDPLFQSDELINLLDGIKALGIKDVLVYTGYKFEEIEREGGLFKKAIELCGVIIDGEYIIYDLTKALAQAVLLPVPRTQVHELSYEELCNVKSERMDGKMGSSEK